MPLSTTKRKARLTLSPNLFNFTNLIYLGAGILLGSFIEQTGQSEKQKIQDRPGKSLPSLSSDIPSKSLKQAIQADPVATAPVLESLRSIDIHLYSETMDAHRETLLLEMVERMGAKHPVAISRLLKTLPYEQNNELSLVLLEKWGKASPRSALYWWESQQGTVSSEQFSNGLRIAIANWAETDPQQAYRISEKLQNPELRDRLFLDIARSWSDQDPQAAFDWLAKLPLDSVSEGAYASCYTKIMHSYAQQDPVSAAKIVLELESETIQGKLLPQILSRISETDTPKALALISRIDSNQMKQESTLRLIRSNDLIDTRAILELSQTNPTLLEGSVEFQSELFSHLAKNDWQNLTNNIDLVPEAGKAQAAAEITRNWFTSNVEFNEIEDWYSGLKSDEASDGVARTMSAHQASEDPLSALNWAERILNTELRLRSIQHIIQYSNPEYLSKIAGALAYADVSSREKQEIAENLNSVLRENYSPLIMP